MTSKRKISKTEAQVQVKPTPVEPEWARRLRERARKALEERAEHSPRVEAQLTHEHCLIVHCPYCGEHHSHRLSKCQTCGHNASSHGRYKGTCHEGDRTCTCAAFAPTYGYYSAPCENAHRRPQEIGYVMVQPRDESVVDRCEECGEPGSWCHSSCCGGETCVCDEHFHHSAVVVEELGIGQGSFGFDTHDLWQALRALLDRVRELEAKLNGGGA